MSFSINSNVVNAVEPPIAEAQSWISGRTFPKNKPLLNLAQAVPSYPPASSMSKHLADKLNLFETAQYTAIAGIPPLRNSLASHMEHSHGGRINPENVLISAGCNQAFCLTIMAVAKAGDEVILSVPYYFNHMMWLEMLGIKPVLIPFRKDLSSVPSPEDVEGLITEKTKAIVLVSPNNPTGAIYPSNILSQFFELAHTSKIALVLDETYKDFLTTMPPHTIFHSSCWEETFVQLYSFSKVFSLTGYRVGSIIGGQSIIDAATKVMDTLAICAPRIAQDAALYGLNNLEKWVANKRTGIQERLNYVNDIFSSNQTSFELISSGAYFAYVKHPFDKIPARDVARHLAEKENILCLPGSFFGPGQEQFLRLAFANATVEELSLLPKRLRSSVDSITFA